MQSHKFPAENLQNIHRSVQNIQNLCRFSTETTNHYRTNENNGKLCQIKKNMPNAEK